LIFTIAYLVGLLQKTSLYQVLICFFQQFSQLVLFICLFFVEYTGHTMVMWHQEKLKILYFFAHNLRVISLLLESSQSGLEGLSAIFMVTMISLITWFWFSSCPCCILGQGTLRLIFLLGSFSKLTGEKLQNLQEHLEMDNAHRPTPKWVQDYLKYSTTFTFRDRKI